MRRPFSRPINPPLLNIFLLPFLTISSILIDLCFNRLIFDAIFNSYNHWYLLSYSNQNQLHYSVLVLISFLFIIIIVFILFLIKVPNPTVRHDLLGAATIGLVILSSSFSYFTLVIIFLDFFVIFSIFFFKGPINSIEVFIAFNLCYPILFINLFTSYFLIQYTLIASLLQLKYIQYTLIIKSWSFFSLLLLFLSYIIIITRPF